MKAISSCLLVFFAAIFVNAANATTVFTIATNQFNQVSALGGFGAFGISNYLVGIQGDTTNPTNHADVTAQLVSTNGTLIGSRISIGRTGGQPFAAFDGTNFLMVWEDDALDDTIGDVIYGQLISQSGALVGSAFPISSTSTNGDLGGVRPVAFSGKNYQVVWQDGSDNDASSGDIHVARINTTGSVLGILDVTTGAVAALTPAITLGTTNGLIIWNNRRAGGTELYDIYGEFLTTNHTLSSPFVISQTPTPSYNPCSAAFDGTNFFVVWNKDIGPGYPSPTQWNVYGRLVSPNGTFLGSETALVTDTNNPVYPLLAFDGANYLMSWSESGQTTNAQVYFQFYNNSASSIGPLFTLFSNIGTNMPVFGGATFDGNRFMAAATIGAANGGDNGGGQFAGSTGVYGTFIHASTASPTLTASNFVGTQFPLQLAGTPGINYSIQFSTNLAVSNWTGVTTNSPTNGAFSFTDASATNASRFYRAVKQ